MEKTEWKMPFDLARVPFLASLFWLEVFSFVFCFGTTLNYLFKSFSVFADLIQCC